MPTTAAKDLPKAPENPPQEAISGAPVPPPDHRVVAKEEKVEYRDQDGNLLDPEQVKALEGKVEFKTRYETRTRVIDEHGNELQMPEGGWPEDLQQPVAPPHPDVEGVDSETVKKDESVAPQDVAESQPGEKEAEEGKPKPASEVEEATVREEL